MSPRLLAVINPGSGNAAPDEIVALLRQRFSEIVLLWPEGDDLVSGIAEAIDRHAPEIVAAVGGDGTVAAVATAMGTRDVAMGVVPTGTANVLARELGIGLDPEAACDTLVHGVVRKVDALRYADRRCLVRVGLGVFSEIGAASTPSQKKTLGPLAYAKNALPLLLHSPVQTFELDIDGRGIAIRGSSVVVTNTAQVGWGRMRWGQNVSIDDGRADVFVLHGQTLPENLDVVWSAVEGDTRQSEEVTHFDVAHHVVVRAERSVAAVADGEPHHAEEHWIGVEPAAVRVLVPQPRDEA